MPPTAVLNGPTAAITKCACFVLVCLPCLYVLQKQQNSIDSEASSMPGVFNFSDVSRSAPKAEIISGQSIVWENVKSPKGVLLLFHGCSHSATDWWDKQKHADRGAPKWHGGAILAALPEEKRIVSRAIARRYVVVAFSSQDRTSSRCWEVVPPPRMTSDMQKTQDTVMTMTKREGWKTLPIFALGASSGGALAALIPFHLKLQGSCVQIMAVPPDVYKGAGVGADNSFPPMLFVHMVRDGSTGSGVAQDVAVLTAERINNITAESSKTIFDALQTAGLLAANGLLKRDPRRTGDLWRAALKPHVEAEELKADESAIPEALNLAWAGHEIISDTTDEMLDWFESQNALKSL